MSETVVIPAKRRKELGSRASIRLRDTGSVPAVLYGHHEEVVPIAVETTVLEALIRHGGHGLLEVDVEGKKESAVIKDLQWDVFGRHILHVDFARVSKDESIVVEVPVVIKGNAPGVTEGGVIDQPMHTIEIRCSAGNIQEQVVVNVGNLHVGQHIYVKDLELNAGAVALHEAEGIVVQILKPTSDATDETGVETAEPELIRREKAEEGEESKE